nr:hypothetical protein [Tanacetum cinerariifolium]
MKALSERTELTLSKTKDRPEMVWTGSFRSCSVFDPICFYLADQDDVGTGSGVYPVVDKIKTESIVIQVEAQRLIQFDLIVLFFNVYSQTTGERSARYASTSLSEHDTPSSRSSRSGDHRRSRRDSTEYDRRE